MKTILLHPTHRKRVKRLRQHIENGKHLIVTQQDINSYHELMKRTQSATERHKGIYRILLNIMKRTNYDKTATNAKDFEIIEIIEKTLANAERKRPCTTIRNIIAMPVLRRILYWTK